ncbi:hypothetical protein K458DRAFT_397175 [Lentithecium fluviatile CBS 122367]|uniref:Uncharacterized protein n=1 Tax=Lentithecium fluviatile CBS 122367 TaxID=1168545 RepID=A0A6G1IDV1_9PLEO|nr:hypothetical protein K458DRAFT_397175 [Lentithecium fluviatile CBS 122367]
MADDALDTQSLFAHQLSPALVLDRSGTVLAANKGSRRLISPSHHDATSILGNNIADLSIVPAPGSPPILWTWDEILEGAIYAHVRRDGIEKDDYSRLRRPSASVYYQETDNFWNQEAEKHSIVESDVYVGRNRFGNGAADMHGPTKTSDMIRARASVRWLPTGQGGSFLVTFNRTSLPLRPPVTSPSVAAPEPVVDSRSENAPPSTCCSCHKPIEKFSLRLSPDLEGVVPSASDIASSIIPYIMAILDTDGQVIDLSESWYRFSGLDKEESIGTGWLASIHPDDMVKMTAAWADVLRNKRSHWTHQARYRRGSDGTYSWFLIRAQPFKDASGDILRWYASMMDINEWVTARLEADRRRQSMLTLFSQTDVMLWGIDTANHLHICEGRLDWNPSRVVHLLSERALRRGNTHTNGEAENSSAEELILTVEAILQGRKFSPIVEHWEGNRYFRTRFVVERAIPGGNVQAALALTFDVSDERVRSTLRMENQRLVNNEKVALDASILKSRFLANMSHEIRTPISGIIGLSEHLLECGLSEEQTEFANSVLESAKFLLTLINDVLDFSKIESGHMDVESIPFSPYKLINDVLVPLRLQAQEKGLALNSSCNLNPDAIFLGDPWRMRQILTNLVGNSLKFTGEGHVDLDVTTLGSADVKTVNIQFIVRDSGVGIGEEAMKALFKPFHQADSSTARLHGGTGLGLVICQQLVELMGGHITLQSTPGKGTTATCNIPFQIYNGPTSDLLKKTPLPHRAKFPTRADSQRVGRVGTEVDLGDDSDVRMRPSPGSRTSSTESEMHVLLVEDNHINRKVIALALKKLGYAVSTACDGQEALDYLCKQSERPRPNAVLMDCMMPVIDGYEATRRIRSDSEMFDEQVRALPIIALTASAIKGDREKCWEAGMDDYLTKPAARDALARTLSKWSISTRSQRLGDTGSASFGPDG